MTEVEHAHAFPAEPGGPGGPVRIIGDCECGMSVAVFLQLHNDGSNTVGMRLDPPAETKDDPPQLTGQIIITWPKSWNMSPPHPARIQVTDYLTGLPITTFTDLTVSMELGTSDYLRSHTFIAEMTMLCDQDGKPLIPKSPRDALVEHRGPDGQPLTARFRFLVADFEVAP